MTRRQQLNWLKDSYCQYIIVIVGLYDNEIQLFFSLCFSLRERFVSFGQVGDVQIIQRKDENGILIAWHYFHYY